MLVVTVGASSSAHAVDAASGANSGGNSGANGANSGGQADNPDNTAAPTHCIVLPKDWCSKNKAGTPTQSQNVVNVLKFVLYVMAAGVGVAAVAAIVWAAILYSSASDNASQVEKAKDIIKQVVWGLVLFVLMGFILNFLIPGGVL